MMRWIRGIVGILFALVGLVWIGQGTMLLPGSYMSGHLQWAVAGLVVLAVGVWLLWGAVRPNTATSQAPR